MQPLFALVLAVAIAWVGLVVVPLGMILGYIELEYVEPAKP